MTKQHTPGPWGAQHVFGTCYSVQCAGGQYHVGTIRGKQNARLIAVAPDLLALHKKHMELMMEIAQELKSPRLPLVTTVAASVRMLAEATKESLDVIAKSTGATE